MTFCMDRYEYPNRVGEVPRVRAPNLGEHTEEVLAEIAVAAPRSLEATDL